MTIKAGSVVRLKSGGPLMTVGEVDGKGAGREAACIWHPKVNGEWIIHTAEDTIPLSMLEEAGPDEEIDEALTDACTERDMLAARLKEVEAERDALKAAAERQEAEIAKLEGRLRRFEGPGFAGGDVS